MVYDKPMLSKLRPGDTAGAYPGDQWPASELVIRYKGPFDWTYVFRTIYRWFEQRRFRFYEARHKETEKRIKHDFSGERKVDEFFKEVYGFKVEMWDLSRKQVTVHGEPRIIYNGLVQVRIRPKLEADWAGFYKGATGFKKVLGNLLMDARWKEIESTVLDTMEYRGQDIQTMIKKALNMSTKENAPWNVAGPTNAHPPPVR